MNDLKSRNARSGCGYVIRAIASGRCPECGRTLLVIEAIARYREAQVHLRRTLILCKDRVVVRGKYLLGNEFESPADLSMLDPDPSLLRIRHRWFPHSVLGRRRHLLVVSLTDEDRNA